LVLVPKSKSAGKSAEKYARKMLIFLRILTLETKTNKFSTFKNLFGTKKDTWTKTKNSRTYRDENEI
jgi:hypothetical protein